VNVPYLAVVLSTVYSILLMIRVLGTVFAALMGLAFGSFLNVCLTRWPAGESVVKPGSHCRNCGRTLAWWENVPLVSWLALRGRCRTCGTWIGWRYPLVEASVSALWAVEAWHGRYMLEYRGSLFDLQHLYRFPSTILLATGMAALLWLLVALTFLDAEHFWLPDKLTLPGIALGLVCTIVYNRLTYSLFADFAPPRAPIFLGIRAVLLAMVVAGGLMLLTRAVYWLVRRKEGLGLGDAKLMAMLAAWLGLPGALLSFAIGVVMGSLVAIVLLIRRKQNESWAGMKLPLGTFLCIGGIVSSLWGQPIIAAYLKWAGF